MKTTGVSRCIDELGRVVIPKSMRNKLGISSGDPLEFKIEGGSIVITPDRKGCAFCHSEDGLVEFKGRCVCSLCLNELREGK